jgi:hypothetical protein
MATINLTTQLFENLTDQEANELQVWVEDAVLRGKFPPTHPNLIQQWFLAFSYNPDQQLLVFSVALPQRVLLSLLHKRDQEFGELPHFCTLPFLKYDKCWLPMESPLQDVSLVRLSRYKRPWVI